MNIANANIEIRFGSIVSAALLRLLAYLPLIPAVSLRTAGNDTMCQTRTFVP
jgi:hypothetical protein